MSQLIKACKNKYNTTLILKLIESNQNIINHVDDDNNTALIIACENEMTEVALKLIEICKTNLIHINNIGNTVLIYACENSMSDVALKLI